MSEELDRILRPTLIRDLQVPLSLRNNGQMGRLPVRFMVWQGRTNYEMVEITDIYPFDTVESLKYRIYEHFAFENRFLPRFTFIGIPTGDDAYRNDQPTIIDITYEPLEFLWYPTGSTEVERPYDLSHPQHSLRHSDNRFVASDGSFGTAHYEWRGRSTVEDVFLKHRDGQFPIFHVFPLQTLLREWKGTPPMGEEDWNTKFAMYFPKVDLEEIQPTEADKEFGRTIRSYIVQRRENLRHLTRLLEREELPAMKLTGIQQLRLIWKKPVEDFEGSASLFYRIHATKLRPYLRLYPSDGAAITKLHVKGIVPIPTLEDPRVLETWAKDGTFTPGVDCCVFKYVHRPVMDLTPPIYGTVQLFNDGTMNLSLQPPKQVRRLDPVLDFRHMKDTLYQVFDEITHQSLSDVEVKELAVQLELTHPLQSKRWTRARIEERLPSFQPFFTKIPSLPEDNAILSLRYKAVSQYASEDKIFTYITQYTTARTLDGVDMDEGLLQGLQSEFTMSAEEARRVIGEWLQKRSTYTVQVPQEGEFMESFNPGIDIHIYSQHPVYRFHIHRIDGYEHYLRIYALLSLLFMDNDDLFFQKNVRYKEMNQWEEEIEHSRMGKPTKSISFAAEENELDEEDIESYRQSIAHLALNAMGVMENEGDAYGPHETLPPSSSKAAQAAVSSSSAPPSSKELRMKPIHPNNWFLLKLQEMDSTLFKFNPTIKGKRGYSSKCGSADDRQPAVLTQGQYLRMRDIYEDDPIFWIEYPLTGDSDPIQPLGKEEQVTVLRYGSDVDHIYYYFCPHFFCLYDEIMVREVDFVSRIDRQGAPKPPNSCPFCHGLLITDRSKMMEGHTVIQRKNKEGTTKPHQFIQFLAKAEHPSNLSLPCCFVKQKTLRMTDERFDAIRKGLIRQMASEADGDGKEAAEQEEEVEKIEMGNAMTDEVEEDGADEWDDSKLVHHMEYTIQFAVLFQTLPTRYILDGNKTPRPGVFAIAPPHMDAFFHQDSLQQIAKRVTINLKLLPHANGFIRIGTENTPYESLLGAIAPLIFKNSISEVKEHLLKVVSPRIFLNSHFGNLVLEFYNPLDRQAMPPTQQELLSWADKELGIRLNSTNVYALLRIYNAYKRFIAFIENPNQRKDLRHLQPLLAEPGLFTTHGIQLLIIEDNGPKEPVQVKCPVFGVSADRNKKNDVAFIARTMRTIRDTQNTYASYELYLHTSNKGARGKQVAVNETILRWDYKSRPSWPDIVRQRIDEYMTQCQSRHRSLYTSQQGVHPMALMPLSKAVESVKDIPSGLIKDHYNHIVAITFRMKPGSNKMVAFPVVDDGVISISSAFSIKNIYLDWMDYDPAPIEEIVNYYQTKVEKQVSLYPGYSIQSAVRERGGNKIVAIQLRNGIYLPASPPKDQAAYNALNLPVVEVDEFEWELNKHIMGIPSNANLSQWDSVLDQTRMEKSCGTDPRSLRQSTTKEMEETYQTFRYMFANWITGSDVNSTLRKEIETIIFNKKLPLYERRKRLYLYLSTELMSWFYPDPEEWEKGPQSFLRKDCRVARTEEQCSGACKWVTTDEYGLEGKCSLHIPSTTVLSETRPDHTVNTAELFIKRLLDELIRYPIRRRQLLTRKGISSVTKVLRPIHDGDQYIIPESSLTWTNLLRLDWIRQTPEKARFYEEMSRDPTTEEEKYNELPDELIPLFGVRSGFTFQDVEPNEVGSFPEILGISSTQLGLDESTEQLSSSNLLNYVRYQWKPIGLITITDRTTISFARPEKGTFLSIPILVQLPGRFGILREENSIEVSLDRLPPNVQREWEQAEIVIRKKKPVFAKQPEYPVIEQIPIKIIPTPLVAKQDLPPLRKKLPVFASNEEVAKAKQEQRKPSIKKRPVFASNEEVAEARQEQTKPSRKKLPVFASNEEVAEARQGQKKRGGRIPRRGSRWD